jgi:hypothetical protein
VGNFFQTGTVITMQHEFWNAAKSRMIDNQEVSQKVKCFQVSELTSANTAFFVDQRKTDLFNLYLQIHQMEMY